MKKHELLKYAYDNYPKGVKFTFTKGDEIKISSGKFHISENEYQGWWIADSETRIILYSSDKKEWPEKPQFITVAKDSQYPVEVYNDRIRIKCNGSENHSDNIIIRESELKEIYEAYYSLRD